jgi:uncharacterized membrane protein
MRDYWVRRARPHAPGEAPLAAPILKDARGHGRALAKGVSWRIIGTLDTFLWSLLITKQPFSAGSIATFETITKIALFYGHERAWRLVPWAPNAHMRSLVKAVSWRVIGSLDTFMLSFLVTGSAKWAVSIATAEALTKIVLYYLHERAWRLVRWGRFEAPAEEAAKPSAGAVASPPKA